MGDELLAFIRATRAGLSDAQLFRALDIPVPQSVLALEADAAAPPSKKRKKALPVPKFSDEAVASMFRRSCGMPRRKLAHLNTIDDVIGLIERYALSAPRCHL